MKLADILTGPEAWLAGSRDMGQRGDHHCLVTAIVAIDGDVDRLVRAVQAVAGHLPESIPAWQDERTWDEIAAVVRAYDSELTPPPPTC